MGVHTAVLLLPAEPSPDVERATQGWLERRCRLRVRTHRLPPCPRDGRPPVAWVAQTFAETAALIEREAAASGGLAALRDFAVYTEAYDPDIYGWDDLQPLSGTHGPQTALLWMLVLAFPEVHWVFHSPYRLPDGKWFPRTHTFAAGGGGDSVVRLHKSGFNPLFDPAGVREMIRRNLSREAIDGHRPFAQIPRREAEAVALDEEPEYAAFTAYLAYRQGYRCWSIPSMELMRWRLSDRDESGGALALALEDVFLSYPDRSFEEGLSDLSKRHDRFPPLAAARHRVLITVGRGLGEAGGDNAARNRDYLRRLRRSYRILYKPLTGVFETVRQAGIKKVLEWPPAKRRAGPRQEEYGHSAPGRPLAVAGVLIARAQTLLGSSPSVHDAIHAAVLALDAKELLGGRTPTAALRAVALQQEAEVVAESLFLGVQHNLDVRKRLREIKTEVEFVGRWVHRSQQRRAILNARMTIAEQLAKRYRDFNQFEEESACLAEARKLRFDFWALERPARWPLWPFLRYLSFSLSSLGRFVAVVAAWTIFFGVSYYALGLVVAKPNLYLGDAMASSTKLFFTGNSSANWEALREAGRIDNWEVFWKCWVTFQSVVSIVNIGLLLSHLYLVISRR